MLQLLRACSGAFRPGVLTALVGSSGAGKTTLMDVIAGRKTSAGPFRLSNCPLQSSHRARLDIKLCRSPNGLL